MTDGEKLARACVSAATDRKADDPVVLDLRGISTFTDYFVICSGTSEPQLKAIADEIGDHVRETLGRKPLSEDGHAASQWIVLDYGDVTVHVLNAEKRAFYGLENLWSDAKQLTL